MSRWVDGQADGKINDEEQDFFNPVIYPASTKLDL